MAARSTVGDERDSDSDERHAAAEQRRQRLGEEVGDPSAADERSRDHAEDEPDPAHVHRLVAKALDVALVEANHVEGDASHREGSKQPERVEVAQ